MSYCFLDLGPEALDFLRKRLRAGGKFGSLVETTRDLESGFITGILPHDRDDPIKVDLSRLNAPVSQVEYELGGFREGSAKFVRKRDWAPLATRLLHTWISEATSRRAVFAEEALGRPRDADWAVLKGVAVGDGGLYYYIRGGGDVVPALQSLVRAVRDASWYGVIAMIELPGEGSLSLRNCDVGEGFLDTIAAAVKKMIVGAYDDEGFVLWEAQRGLLGSGAGALQSGSG